ncbi:MAG: methyltransferase domain-containing protein [Chloroflexota bacterium]|nr:methyltransferase domain-containing protein [Chloroflexota bacterium]
MADSDLRRWAEKDFAYRYLEEVNVWIPDRYRLLEILKDFYQHFMGGKTRNRVLDLGCGDGILTSQIWSIDDSISATLIDGSDDMINRAQERFAGAGDFQFIKASFQEIVSTDAPIAKFDIAVSSLAIHHLTRTEKLSLFGWAFCHLIDGGYFVNIDIVRSPAKDLEKWYFSLWRKWMVEKQSALGMEPNYDGVIGECTSKEHYSKIDSLDDQLSALREVGFIDVDCFHKYGVFAMYGGRK